MEKQATPFDSDQTGIFVRVHLRNPILSIHSPHVTIDATTYDVGWGDHFFPVPSGRHEVRVFVTQFIFDQLEWGGKHASVDVQPGQTTLIRYSSPLMSFGKGKLSVDNQR